jgi:hypothetical protein
MEGAREETQKMKKLLLLVGVGVGFILGSRAGKEPYQRLENTLRELSGRPEVKQAVDAASEKMEDLADKAGAKVSDAIPT